MTGTRTTDTACYAIRSLLDGAAPNGAEPSNMGPHRECYEEMARAYGSGGTDAARKVFAAYAREDQTLATLVAGGPAERKRQWTAAELLAEKFPDPKWIVPGLLTEGLTLLAGRPKLGKSWLALQIAVGVGAGGHVLGNQVQQGRVLYLALEDNERRIQDRLRKQRAPSDAQIDFRFGWPYLADGGTADLTAAVDEHGYNLVIVDTLSRVLGRADQMDQGEMGAELGALQQFAIGHSFALLLVDHHRKTASDVGDVIDDVMGATSKASVADAAWGIYRKRGESGATLKVTGRDINEQELALQWDRDLFCWQSLGDTKERVQGERMQEIIDAVAEIGQATHREIMDATGQDKGNSHKRINDLVARGVLRRVNGPPLRYALAGEGE